MNKSFKCTSEKAIFRTWFLGFCTLSVIIIPIYYFGWDANLGEDFLNVF